MTVSRLRRNLCRHPVDCFSVHASVHSRLGCPLWSKGVHTTRDIRLKQVYPWQAAYNAAILETDQAAMPLRVYEALAAIEQRRLSPIEEDSAEDRALRAAEEGLETLRAERGNGFEGRKSTSDE